MPATYWRACARLARTGLGLLVAVVPAALEQSWTVAFDAATAGAVVCYALVPTVGGYLL